LVTYVNVLGPTLVSVGSPPDESTPPIRRKMVRELLLLLVHRRRLRREEIATVMWPDKDESAARNNLRATLNHLRTLLENDDADDAGPPWHVRSDGESLELFVSDRLAIDALDFDAAVRAARRADSERRPAETLSHCLRAIDLYAGPYLDDALDPDWAFNQRMNHHLHFVEVCVRASELREARGEADGALDLARRAVDAEPLSERAHRALVRALLATDDRAGANRAYGRCIDILAADGLSPDDETVRLRASL
jgi:DNA-binding SARP family transcriptional activator